MVEILIIGIYYPSLREPSQQFRRRHNILLWNFQHLWTSLSLRSAWKRKQDQKISSRWKYASRIIVIVFCSTPIEHRTSYSPSSGPPFDKSYTWRGFNMYWNFRKIRSPWRPPLFGFTNTSNGHVPGGWVIWKCIGGCWLPDCWLKMKWNETSAPRIREEKINKMYSFRPLNHHLQFNLWVQL